MSTVKAPLLLQYTGIAGDYRVASELFLRGVNVYISKLDHGVDLILSDGRKIQVKTAHLRFNPANNSKYYHFVLKSWYFRTNGERKRSESDLCDFFVFWCIEADTFYIVPSKDLGDRAGIDLFPASIGASPHRKTKFPRDRSKFNIYKDKWDYLI